MSSVCEIQKCFYAGIHNDTMLSLCEVLRRTHSSDRDDSHQAMVQPEQNFVCFNSTHNYSAKKGALRALLPIYGIFSCCLAMVPPPFCRLNSLWTTNETSSHKNLELFSISSLSTTTKKPPLCNNPAFFDFHPQFLHSPLLYLFSSWSVSSTWKSQELVSPAMLYSHFWHW